MAGQLDSPHFFRTGDTVSGPDGSLGSVLEGRALYAIVAWPNDRLEEIDQFDSSVIVVQRTEQA